MKIKQWVYLVFLLVSITNVIFNLIDRVNGEMQPFINIFNSIDFVGIGLIVLAVILLKLSFDISTKLELFLIIVGFCMHFWSFYYAPLFELKVHTILIFSVFPLFTSLFYIEFIKDLLLSDHVFTVKSIVGKSLIALTVIFVIVEISKLFILVTPYTWRGPEQIWTLFITVILMQFIYLNKLGYRRSIRKLDEQAFFVDDMRKMSRRGVRNADLMLYALYGMILFGLLMGKLDLIHLLIVLVGGIFFAARGYKNWMFPFVFVGMAGVIAYMTKKTPAINDLDQYLLNAGVTYIKLILMGILLPYVYELINRFGVATFSNSSNE